MHIRLEEPPTDSIRLLSDQISLAEGQRESWETITRVVKFDDKWYGEVEITRDMLNRMIKNFQDNVYGQDIAVDIAHNPSAGAAGFIRELQLQSGKLRGRIEWTDFGREAVQKKGFRYFSAEYHENYSHPETGKKHGALLMGAALTTRPRVKHLDPINPERLQLSLDGEGDDAPVLVTPKLSQLLLNEALNTMNIHKQKLMQALQACKLSETIQTQLGDAFETAARALGDDEKSLDELVQRFDATGADLAKQLSEGGREEVKLSIDLAGLGKTLGEDDIKRILAEQQAATDTAAAEATAARESNLKILSDAIGAQDSFGDELKRELTEAVADLISAEMTPEQVKRLAANQIAMGNKLNAQAKLSSMGFTGASGSVHISVDDSNAVKALQETADRRMGILDMSESKRFATTGGALCEENKKFAEQVLAQFDEAHAADLRAEHKQMAGGDGVVSDVSVPVVWERTVIREALYRLVGLQFVNVGTESFGTSYSIPYSYRDTTAAGRGDTRKYEGQSIGRAGVIQTAETAYNLPQKLAFEVSDELRLLTAARHLNWDAVAENQQNASRIIGEDTEQVIFNEVLRAADEYGAVAVTGEDLELQADGIKTIFVLANFPVVRPRAVYDLQGNQVGSTSNPITVSYNATPVEEYDGTGTQATGTYYVLDYNLGEIYLVNQAGAVQAPANTVAYTISYSYASNVYAFDTDLGSSLAKDHWNTFLYRYGLRKAILEDDRYHMANFGLMSGTTMNQIEQAEKFAANYRVPGTDLGMDGNLGRIKDIANFKTSAPSLWMGDQRVLIGERGITRLRMTNPWSMGELQDQHDANGRFTGKKEAYGTQHLVCHTPTQLKRAYTSIVLYSATNRVAR